MTKLSFLMTSIALLASTAESFVSQTSLERSTTSLEAINRRAFFSTAGAAAAFGISNAVFAEQAPEYRQDIKVDAFNGLAFNYKGGDFGGLKVTELNEPSVSYAEFNDRLKKGEVDFVEFMAPDGDAAYATFKSKEGETKESPIRIGEGYPIEQHDGYSSPMFCVRAVKNAGVPYKFTVPALAKLNK